MGTGVIATAGATLPAQFPALHAVATLFWVAASLLLLLLAGSTVVHWTLHRDAARGHHNHPVMAHFYGAPPMALLTVGAGTLLLGKDVLGERLALGIDAVLWVLGTLLGLASAFAVPYLQFTRHKVSAADAFGGWLMPVVPPMVSASTGALLLPYLPAGEARTVMLMACYAMFGLSLLASLFIIPLVSDRWASPSPPPTCSAPTRTLRSRAHCCTRWKLSVCCTGFPCWGSPSCGQASPPRSPCAPPAAACPSASLGGPSPFLLAPASPDSAGSPHTPDWACSRRWPPSGTCC
jgi:tellurite resistance protein TehA-like permease